MTILPINPNYSTTCWLSKVKPKEQNLPDAKFERMLFLPQYPQRKGEGGLRQQGYFKVSNNGQAVDNSPLITIVTVVFNGAETIEQTILSVINQSYDNVEYIIIDGGSTDGTVDILRKYEHAIDYWVSESDMGIYDAWNKAVRLSTGGWVAFLGADDIYYKDALQAYVNFIKGHRNEIPEYISSRVNLVFVDGFVKTIGKVWNWKKFRQYMNVAHVGSLHNKSLFEKYGLYDTTYQIAGDYELLLRSQSNLNAAFLDKITVSMKYSGISNNDCRVFEEALKAKISTGGRGKIMSQIEKMEAVFKWKVRHMF